MYLSKHRAQLNIHACLTMLAWFSLLAVSGSVNAADDAASSNKRTAVAHSAAEWDKNGKTAKIEFDFGDFKGWARRDGSWNAAGRVQHSGLLCATYTLSLRVGHGNPGCTNVQWFGDPQAVGSVKLCNNAVGSIDGGNTEFKDAERFDEITCVERELSCDGNCN